MNGHDSPEQAAMAGFPAAHCRVVASEISGNDAYVLLDTGPPGGTYLYGGACHRENGRWFQGGSSNAPGWSPTGDDPDVGALSFWGDAPAGVETVRVYLDGAVVEAPVRNGIYFLVKWRVPVPIEWPNIVAICEHGQWKPESTEGLFWRWRRQLK